MNYKSSPTIILALLTLGIGIGTATAALKCPREHPIRENFDVDRYSGNWYLQLRSNPWNGEVNTVDCISESYDRRGDHPLLLNLTWSGRVEGEWLNENGLATILEPNQWNVYMDGALFFHTNVATDYTSWTIEYACVEVEGVVKDNYLIRSRSSVLSPVVLETLKTILEGFECNPADFVTISQYNCQSTRVNHH